MYIYHHHICQSLPYSQLRVCDFRKCEKGQEVQDRETKCDMKESIIIYQRTLLHKFKAESVLNLSFKVILTPLFLCDWSLCIKGILCMV